MSIPSITLPKTTCFPSKKSHLSVVMKNWKIDENCFGKELYRGVHLGSICVWARIRLDEAEKENTPTNEFLPLIRARGLCASLENSHPSSLVSVGGGGDRGSQAHREFLAVDRKRTSAVSFSEITTCGLRRIRE